MATFLSSARATAITTFNLGNNTLGTADAVVHAARIKAEAFLDNTIVEVEAGKAQHAIIAVAKSQHNVTRKLMELQEECADPKFAAMLAQVQAQWGKPTISLSLVAAE